jgi:hypothetical protein
MQYALQSLWGQQEIKRDHINVASWVRIAAPDDVTNKKNQTTGCTNTQSIQNHFTKICAIKKFA